MHVHANHGGHDDGLDRRLRLSLWVTAAFIVVEFAAGIRANSLALLSDAGHNFTDALALGLALFAHRIGGLPASASKTYGYKRAGVLAAFVNALVLVALSLLIFWESYDRFLNPREVQDTIMLVVAGAGLVVNLVVMKALHGDSHHDLNVRGAYMHMLGDALSSVGIIIGALFIRQTNALWIDPLLSVLIGVLIIWSAWDVIRESLDILLEGAPRGIKLEEVSGALREVEGVIDIHDLHIWSLSSADHALSCHALIEDMPPSESSVILERIQTVLLQEFSICHATVQFEHIECCGAQEICSETALHGS
ncbi:MAG: cation diffusion facilitator family transporter [Acidobacteria bacterium]|nr:cation diffusion facilitator family transporter [Acidobacteriota bacterium]MDA1235173.1 cation diffusion facilitator family transporter [Acidobacteriota bacterium]